jgi:UDP-glucose 4-epimerase
VSWQPRRAGDPPELVADPAKARAVLGWEPRHSSLGVIVESAWRWHCAIQDQLRLPQTANVPLDRK